MDFDKLKSQQKIQSGSKPRRIVLHPAGSQKRSRYGRRVITSNGRVTARSQFVVYNTKAQGAKNQPKRNGNGKRLTQEVVSRQIRAATGNRQVANTTTNRRGGQRNRRNQKRAQQQKKTPEMLNKDLEQYFQNDPAIAKQNLDNQLDEYYRQNNADSATQNNMAPVAPAAPMAPVAPMNNNMASMAPMNDMTPMNNNMAPMDPMNNNMAPMAPMAPVAPMAPMAPVAPMAPMAPAQVPVQN